MEVFFEVLSKVILIILVLMVVRFKSAFNTFLSNVKQAISENKMSEKINGFIFDEDEKTTYDWPVNITKPGQTASHRVMFTLESVSFDDLQELEQQAADDGEATNIVKRIVKDWTVKDNATFRKPPTEENKLGEIIPCNEETKHAVFNRIYITRQVLKAFFDSQGGKKAARKN
jgi:hypothetical protein